jgi:hypothetical protein
MRGEIWDKLLLKIEKNYTDQLIITTEDNTFFDGKKKIDSFFRICINKKVGPLERHQYEIVYECCPIILEWAFGVNYYKKNKDRIQKLCNFSHDKSCVISVIKRQHGKTEMIVRISAASLLVFPLVDIFGMEGRRISEFCIRSYKGDHAKEILNRCWDYIQKFDECLENFILDNRKVKTTTSIELVNKFDSNDVRKLRVLIGKLTGLSKKRFLGDEFFKWSSDASHTQMGPQLQVEGTCGLFFSTLEKSSHWCMGWINSKQELAKVLNYGEICNDCMELPYDKQIKCNHCRQLQAHWIDPKKRKAVISILPKSEVLKEMYNVVSRSTGQIWKRDELNRVFIEKDFSGKKFRDYYVFVDPSMTSEEGSWSGITIIGINNQDEIVICYLNTDKTDTITAIQNFVINNLVYFVDNFKKHSTDQFYITLFVEHNTINHGYELFLKMARNHKLRNRIIFIKNIKYDEKTKEHKRFGVKKKKGDEETFAQLLHYYIVFEKICFHNDWVTRNSIGKDGMKDILITQITHVKNVVPDISNSNKTVWRPQPPPIIISTTDLNGKSTRNDLYTSFASSIYNTSELENPEKRQKGKFIRYIQRKTIGGHFFSNY